MREGPGLQCCTWFAAVGPSMHACARVLWVAPPGALLAARWSRGTWQQSCHRGIAALPCLRCCRSPFILADSLAKVTVGLKLWGPHRPPLEPPSGFFVELTAVHPDGEDWRTGGCQCCGPSMELQLALQHA